MPPARRTGPEPRRTPGADVRGPRRRTSHSLESVLTEAVALLDEAGEPALTFRALAARLGGGVASIYWYVSSKDELLDRAADHVLADVLTALDGVGEVGGDPIDDVRTIGVTLFDHIVDRPWLGAYFLRDTGVQPNSMRLYELIGQQVLRLHLTPQQSFHAVSAVVGFVVGTAADMGQVPPEEVSSGQIDREQYLAAAVEGWRSLDPAEYPFVHHVIDQFATHDDAEQFRAGLDLLLAGLRLQADGQ
ncbi:TetR/AcrR family transcriptional regulator [Terracoccus luteus]|uniref:AcrR family transcriptional regulator n=1 Tax=Terracoccus luteus TaxID=53356 RepID=A0A839PUW8_9MICO|nr:TetR/AcrR family transcriptional regulator [Terracoccus luteus]MBB2987317.1 AcrR family transcriptional regulator [Terracoccus luteus]MCP2172968.1 AcrR family transcriptional regulator [Terracoccus luteus]